MSQNSLAPSQDWPINRSCEGPTINVDGSTIEFLSRVMSERRVAKGDHVDTLCGGVSKAVIICSGIAALVHAYQDGRRQVLELLFAGDLLICDCTAVGETCLLQALTEVSLRETDSAALFEHALERPEIIRTLFHALSSIVLRKNRQLLDLGRKNAGERVASFLIEYGERSYNAMMPERAIQLMVQRGMIADFLCLTRETISRSLTVFREEGLIRMPKHDEIEIVDLDGLRRRARAEGSVINP